MKKLLMILAIVFLVPFIVADQTVKTVEIPFGYIAQTTVNQDYIDTFNIQSPDGIADIISMEIIVRGDFQATTDVDSRVRKNGGAIQSCNPGTWTTPNINTPSYEISFDCSDLINTYDFTGGEIEMGLRTDKIAQNIKGMIKITYYNDPRGDLDLMGTEYRAGDWATLFLQLRDENSVPINTGACYLDVFYPYQYNLSHPIFLDNSPMFYLDDSDGLYYYDLYAPSTPGVYMLSATCSYAYNSIWLYDSTDSESPDRTSVLGTYIGATTALNCRKDSLYTKCSSESVGGLKYCEVEYDFDSTGRTSNLTDINIYYLGQTSSSALLQMYVYNYTNSSWIELSNTLTYAGLSTTTEPLYGIDEALTNEVPLGGVIAANGTITIKLKITSGNTFSEFSNYLSMELFNEQGTITDLKGSGEMHVNNWTLITEVNETLIAQEVWNWSGEVNDNLISRFWNWTGSIADNIGDFFSNKVWTRTDRNLTYYEDVTDYPKLQLYVWNNTDRNLTYYEDTNYTKITKEVWDYFNRTLTYYPPTNNLTADDVWSYVDRNLTYYPPTNNLTAQDVWDYVNRTLTYYPPTNNLTASDVWNFLNRNLTYYEVTEIDYPKLQLYVWNTTDRNLTYYPTGNTTELTIAVWNYSAKYTHGEVLS